MAKVEWKVWKSTNAVACLFCTAEIIAGDAYRLETFYVADVIKSLVDGDERSVYKPITCRVHAECKRGDGMDYRLELSWRLRRAATTHDHRRDALCIK